MLVSSPTNNSITMECLWMCITPQREGGRGRERERERIEINEDGLITMLTITVIVVMIVITTNKYRDNKDNNYNIAAMIIVMKL